MQYVSLHNHTTFCDGDDSMEDFVRYVIADGGSAIGFSGHSHQSYEQDYTMTKESEKEYCAEIDRLREKFGDRIRIYKGIELEYFCDSDITPYEYIIGSVHLVKKDGIYIGVDSAKEEVCQSVREIYGGNWMAYVRDYYETVIRSASRPCVDIVGHFDLVTKFNEGQNLFSEESPEYLSAAIGALEELRKEDKIYEMNTGAISRGYRTAPYIGSKEILRYMCEHGMRMTVNADAHQKENYRFRFAETAAVLKEAGFQEIWEYNGKEFEPAGL